MDSPRCRAVLLLLTCTTPLALILDLYVFTAALVPPSPVGSRRPRTSITVSALP